MHAQDDQIVSDVEELGADIAIDEVFEELAAKRSELGLVEQAELPPDFRVKLLGGAWLKQTRGTSYDAFNGEVRKGFLAQRWCQKYGLQLSSSFHISVFGERAAHLCAAAWCEARPHYFDVWAGQQDEEYVYTDADVSECPRFGDLRASLPGLGRRARVRAQDVLEFRP